MDKDYSASSVFAPDRLLISVTSAGRIAPVVDPPYVVLIDRAWREDGTSFHCLPPTDGSLRPTHLAQRLAVERARPEERILVDSSRTTDAPFRETEYAVSQARARDILAVRARLAEPRSEP